MTKEERHLWFDFLKNTQERWLRQKIIDNYIVDFYCAKVKLVIEIDGSHHFTEDRIIYDEIRSNILQQYGIEVIRFTNREIMLNFNGVCESIENSVMKLEKIVGQDSLLL